MSTSGFALANINLNNLYPVRADPELFVGETRQLCGRRGRLSIFLQSYVPVLHPSIQTMVKCISEQNLIKLYRGVARGFIMLKPTKTLENCYLTFQIAKKKGEIDCADAQAGLRLCCLQATKQGFFTSRHI